MCQVKQMMRGIGDALSSTYSATATTCLLSHADAAALKPSTDRPAMAPARALACSERGRADGARWASARIFLALCAAAAAPGAATAFVAAERYSRAGLAARAAAPESQAARGYDTSDTHPHKMGMEICVVL